MKLNCQNIRLWENMSFSLMAAVRHIQHCVCKNKKNDFLIFAPRPALKCPVTVAVSNKKLSSKKYVSISGLWECGQTWSCHICIGERYFFNDVTLIYRF